MTLIVGFSPDGRDRAGLELHGMLARSAGDELVVATVVPAPWSPGMARVDAEYRARVDALGNAALAEARAHAPEGVQTRFVLRSARSVAAGLLELVDEEDARLLGLGSSSAGNFGHVALGSVSARLLHSSPVPLALAPRGFRCGPAARVRRVTVAYGGSSQSDLVVAAARVASDVGASLRLASFAVWSPPDYTSTLGTDSEAPVLEEWTSALRATVQEALSEVDELAAPPSPIECVVGRGARWGDALDDVEWADGDVLVVGSSALGPVARVFLGSRAAKIVRHSPVPVVMVPRGAE